MEQEFVTFERIIFDMQLDLYNSVKIEFDDFFIGRDFYQKIRNFNLEDFIYHMNGNDIRLWNFSSRKFNHADYIYIYDNNFKLKGITYGSNDIW